VPALLVSLATGFSDESSTMHMYIDHADAAYNTWSKACMQRQQLYLRYLFYVHLTCGMFAAILIAACDRDRFPAG
jgi:hypothetical protein